MQIGSALAGPTNPPLGIDIATANQGYITPQGWQQIANANYKFVYIRGSLGVDASFRDSMLSTQVQNASAVMLTGVYHVAYPSQDTAIAEADWFFQEAGRYMVSNYLRPVLDIETPDPATSGINADYTQWVIDFSTELYNKAHVTPIIYTSSGYASKYLRADALSNYTLWISSYGATPINSYDSSRSPTLGSFTNWALWQFSKTGRFSAINNGNTNVDLDAFNGNIAGLESLVIPSGNSQSDLTLQSVSVPSGSTYASGATIQIATVVQNIGQAPSPNYRLTYYASTDTSITTSDTAIGYYDVTSSVAAGLSAQTTVNGVLPSNLPNGTYYVGVILTASPDASATNNVNYATSPIAIGTGSSSTISPTTASFGSSGGSGSFTVSTGASTHYAAIPNQDWISISANGSGNGSATVSYFISSNSSSNDRPGTISVQIGTATQTFSITQSGTPLSGPIMSIDKTQFSINSSAYGGSSILSNPGTGAYSWTATPNAPWINVTSGQGTVSAGSQNSLNFTVQQNSSTTQRVGTIAVFAPNTGNGSQTITITQDGEVVTTGPILALSTNQFNLSAGTGSYSFAVYNQGSGTLSYSANSDALWIGFPYPSGTIYPSGTGVPFSVQENTSTVARTATITVTAPGATGSPQTISVTQAGKSSVTPPPFAWANASGAYAVGMALDSNANAYVVGGFSGTANFGGTSLTATGDSDIFLVKYDSGGNVIWARRAGSTGSNTSDQGAAITLDPLGNIYITGEYQRTATFGGLSVTSVGNGDVFIAKYDNAGNVLWVRSAGGQYGDGGSAIAADTAGNCYVTGFYTGTSATFGGTALTNTGGQYDGHSFLAKYDTSGNFLFVKPEGGNALSLDSSGNLYLAGSSNAQSVTFSGVTITNGNTAAYSSMAYLVKYGPGGGVLWAKSVSGAVNTTANVAQGYSVAVDSSGNSYLTGQFAGQVNFGSNKLTSFGSDDSYLCKFDPSGNILWVHQNGSPSTSTPFIDAGESVATDAAGNAYLTGRFMGTAAFGNTNLTSFGDNDVFVTKFDTSGNELWVQQGGGANYDSGAAIQVAASGDVYVAGSFQSATAFGTINLSASGYSGFVTKLSIPQYTISATSVPTAGGSTSGGGVWHQGDTVTLVATANAGYTFTSWSENGSLVYANAVYSFTATANRALAANFAVIPPPVSPPQITSATSASAQVNAPFTYQITASNSPTGFGASGLPAGLSVNAAGLISGTPTQSGTFSVSLSATNSGGTGTAALTLAVATAPPSAPGITSPLSASMQVGQSFTYQITATNAPTGFNATGLPSGLGVNGTSGLISGTSTASGTYQVALSATNAGGTGTATLTLTVVTAPVQPPTITSAAGASTQVGTSFTYQTTATNSPTSFGASGLPANLSVNGASGIISGTTTQTGTFTVGLTATNAGGTGSASLTLIVSAAPVVAPVITSVASATAQITVPFTYQITASNSPTSFGSSGLPTGLSANSAGLISGVPAQSGTFPISLYATNASGTGIANLTLTVLPAPLLAPVIGSPTTANGQEGQTFTYQITASNNPTSFGASGLPTGLNLNMSTGLVSGTPTQYGTFPVSLSAVNASGTGTASLTLTIAPAPVIAPVITSVLAADVQEGQPFSYQITASNSPTSFDASGLPTGLNIDSATGLISGIPIQAGSFPVTLGALNAGGRGTANLTITVASVLPVVTLIATTPTVMEGSGEQGVFTLSLSAPQDQDVTVSFTIKGSAVNGSDYVLLKGTKKIKAGKTSKPIKVTPLGDGAGPGVKRTVVIVLAPGDGYTVGTTGKVKVKIIGQ